MKLHLRGEADSRKVEVDPATDRTYVDLVNFVRCSWSLTRRCPRDPQSYVSLVKIRWKVAPGSPGPMFYGTCCGPENSPQGGRSALLRPPGGGSDPAVRVGRTARLGPWAWAHHGRRRLAPRCPRTRRRASRRASPPSTRAAPTRPSSSASWRNTTSARANYLPCPPAKPTTTSTT